MQAAPHALQPESQLIVRLQSNLAPPRLHALPEHMPTRPEPKRTPPKRSAPHRGAPRLSRLRAPHDLSPAEWQTQLRRQFGREQSFELVNLGTEPVFSDFAVGNPQSGGRYRVAIRGTRPGDNFCTCPDFETNDLGTCKHIEFTLARIEARRDGGAALEDGYHPSYSELYLHSCGERSVRLRPGTACPRALEAAARRLFDANAQWTLPHSRFNALEAFLATARKARHEVRCHENALTYIAQHRDAEHRRRVLESAYRRGARSAALGKLMRIRLYPYQAEGALFAARAGRAIIADEMGLGKTVQAIAAAELLIRHFGAERVLVVCPTSLKHQWQREIGRTTGRDAQVIQGLRTVRARQYREAPTWKIASYDTLNRDLDLIGAWAPDLVIVDEAQRIKNWNTIASRTLKRVESPYAIVLTGTPLENRIEELVSIVQFVDRHRLGPTWRLLHEHQLRDEAGRVIGYRDLDRIGATLAPIMLRRRKAEVLGELPERIDETVLVPMTPEQLTHHNENADTVARIVARWRRTGYLSDADQRILTCALQNMRMSCNSTYLIDHETDHGTKADELMNILEALLEEPHAKAVIFSQWVGTHELIVRRLESKGWGHVLFHGGIPAADRPRLIERFSADPACRVFLSTDAGGVGLNLQHAAAAVINMDLPWNPAVLEQRIGRVHRLGQKRSVHVVNFVAQGTIEEGMLSLLAFKKSLFAGVLDGGEREVFLHGTRLSRFMESVDKVTSRVRSAEPVAQTEPAAEDEAYAPERADAPAAASPAMNAGAEAARAPADGQASIRTADPWAPLLTAGLTFVQGILQNMGRQDASPHWIETDARTGQSYLKLPVPEPQAVQRIADALRDLIAGAPPQ
jgi:superfamily II DNA or RNA helicase